jgi:hypothetical protein
VNVDLHTHTFPASTCSRISHRDYLAWCHTHQVEAIALTNHGSTRDARELESGLKADGVLLIHGVEISTPVGDFIVYSPDLDFLDGFRDVQDAPVPGELPGDAALVWVHPAAGGGRSHSAFFHGLERLVADVIDAVEVYNGNWLGGWYVESANAIAAQLGVARTGGSDAHEVGRLMACYTEVPDPVRSTEDVVTAIKRQLTVPRRSEAPCKRRLGLF